MGDGAVGFHRPEAGGIPHLTIGIPAEFQVVGENQVWQALPVTLKLVALFGDAQIVADVLAFDVTDGDAVALYDEVWGARIAVGGIIYGDDTVTAQGLDQCFKGGTVGMLSGLAGSSFLG